MILRTLAPCIASTVVLAACSGGGASPNASTQTVPNAAQQTATGTLTIGAAPSGSTSSKRRPAYVSPSTKFATLWIDSNATGDREACSVANGLATGTCTINWVSTSGTHTFTVAVDDATSINGPGNILGDASVSETLQVGANSLANITLNGVVAQIGFVSEVESPAGAIACESLGQPTSNCYQGELAFEDADGNDIVYPGHYDQLAACLVQNGSLIISQGYACYGPGPQAGLTYPSFWIDCIAGATGTFTMGGESQDVLLGDDDDIPYGTGYGEVSPAQQATYSLSHPSQSAYVMDNWPSYSCADGTVTAVGPANGGVVVQTHH
jgi:hypothetical protein